MGDLKQFEGRTIYASEYYYGCQPDAWDNMLYPDAIIDRRDKAWELFCELYTERHVLPYSEDINEEKALRLRKVRIAYEDNKQLCDEKSLII